MSTADRLQALIPMLERGERAFAFMAAALGLPFDDIDAVLDAQGLLLSVCAWLAVHPDIDGQIQEFLQLVEEVK